MWIWSSLTSKIELVLLARVEPLRAAQDEFRRQSPRESRQAAERGRRRILLERVRRHLGLFFLTLPALRF